MPSLPSVVLSRCLLAACALLSAPASLQARTVDVPSGAAEFRLDVPDDWESGGGGAWGVTLSKMTWSFGITRARALDSRAAATARLQELAGQFAARGAEGEVKLGEIAERRNPHGVMILSLGATRSGRTRAENHVVVVPPSSYWLVETLGSVEFDAAEFAAAAKALDSITPAGDAVPPLR
jgi:hypothetical protein